MTESKQLTAGLSEPPRKLAPGLSRILWWGTPSVVFSMSNFFTVLLSVLFMFLIYGIPTRALFGFPSDVVRVTSQIKDKNSEAMPSGGSASVVVAPVKVNDVMIEVRGYGPQAEASEKGDTVEIEVPRRHPTDARIVGFNRYPVRPVTLITLGFLFIVPGVLVALWSWVGVRRKRVLLTLGREVRGTALRRIPLPRPLKDMVVVRWEYTFGEETRRFWALQKANVEKPRLLVVDGRAGVLANLLPEPEFDGDMITRVSRGEKYGAIINWVLVGLSLASVLVYVVV